MNFGIIGYGAIGDIHAKTIETLEDATLVAIATRSAESAEKARKKYACDTYTDYHEMLKRNDIDVVAICTPSGMHDQVALDVAASGKHCIVEKPISISVERGERMLDAFDQKGLKFTSIFQHRFDKSSQLLKEAITKQKLGTLHYGTAKTIWFRDDAYYQASNWRGTWAGDGGGALMNQTIHTIDLLQYFMGPVEAVCGKCDTLAHMGMETEDIGLGLLRFKSGALGVIEGTTLAYPGFFSEINIYGQSGSMGIQNDVLHHYHFKDEVEETFANALQQEDEKVAYGWYNLLPYMRQYEDLMDAIKQNRQPLVNGQEGLQAVKIIEAIYESSQKNAWITLNELA